MEEKREVGTDKGIGVAAEVQEVLSDILHFLFAVNHSLRMGCKGGKE